MGRHRKGSVLIGAMDDESVDRALKDLSKKFGLCKSDLIRRFIRDGIATTHQLTDWRRLIGRPDKLDDGRKF